MNCSIWERRTSTFPSLSAIEAWDADNFPKAPNTLSMPERISGSLDSSLCGAYINGDNAAAVMNTWSQAVPEQALRIRLTLQQAAGSGLTAISTIAKAMRRHPGFYWGRISHIFPGEMALVKTALRLINNNPYYGFNGDLGAVKSTGYPNVTWVAKELLLRLDGDGSLVSYAGWISRPAHHLLLLEMLAAFAAHKQEQVGGPSSDEERGLAADIAQMVQDSDNLGL